MSRLLSPLLWMSLSSSCAERLAARSRSDPAVGDPDAQRRRLGVEQFVLGEGYPAIPAPDPAPWGNPPPVGPDVPDPEIEDPMPPTGIPPVHEPPMPSRPVTGFTPDRRPPPPARPHGHHFPPNRLMVRAWRPVEPNGQSHQPAPPLGDWQRAG